MTGFDDQFEKVLGGLEELELTTVNGRITEIVGMLIKAIVPNVKIGEVCLVKRDGEPLRCEVVGFTRDEVFLSPLGDMSGVGPSSEVIPTRLPLHIKVGPKLLGRVLNGLGEPLDTKTKGPLETDEIYPVIQNPPDPLKRQRISEPISVGVRAIDGPLTVGKGQRVGIFAAAGGGKSTLLGMIARNARADINVISLIGERGRELRDFIEKDLGPEGLKRSVVIVSTSDQASQLRLNAAYCATAIAEYFRDQGKSVILMMDSVTRFARALREVGLAAGEPPARAGYTPSVFSTLPKLLERAGNSDVGSITAFYTVLVAGDDMNEPVSDETRSILDGHIILSADLARKYHYPAIDVLSSASRVITSIVPQEHLQLVGKLKEVLANYKKNELLIKIGEYKRGADKAGDFAIDHIDKVNNFLKQGTEEKCSFEETVQLLRSVFK
ncbi:flagellar protein export ATPase FliI [Estrella lausannensis]|uniref:Type 3 secretion system ATPase n=1 Tax=Estrella lausannensis TaxID=483423 RepID=A0A0H5E3F8_9BACT|nr:flagellar protein export ATPase FliI [Estrella lausannensis]CRX37750.1 Type III secretion cytoplasmic ATPase SctN [Estrella lausannensis]